MRKIRFINCCFFLSLFSLASFGQSKSIPAPEYERAFQVAVSETNEQFPFVHTFTSELFENGKLVTVSTHIAERQASGVERQSFRTTEKGTTTMTFQLRTGYGENVYCSTDGKSWIGPQVYECPRTIRVYRPPTPTTVEYSVKEMIVNGVKIKEYRKFEILEQSSGDNVFTEELARIGPDRLFVQTIKTTGNMRTKTITSRLTNSWKLRANFAPIVAPKDVKPSTKGSKEGTTLILTEN